MINGMSDTKRTKAMFDQKCYELAEYFMSEPVGKWSKEEINEMAESIQQHIEDVMQDDEPEPYEEDGRDNLANLGMCEADFR